MTTRFLQAAGTLAAALIVLAGCDSAGLDTAGPSAASAGSCPSSLVGVAGPDNIPSSSSGLFSASMKPGCVINNVTWSISPTSAGTLTTNSDKSATVSSVTAPFTITANVVYDVDNVSSGSKYVTNTTTPPSPPSINITRTSAAGVPIQISWTPPSGAYSTTVKRTVRINNAPTTTTIGGGGYGTSTATDPAYAYSPTGFYNLTYTVTIINSAYQTIADESITIKGIDTY